MWFFENGCVVWFVDGKFDVVEFLFLLINNYVLCVVVVSDGGVWIICDNCICKWNNG